MGSPQLSSATLGVGTLLRRRKCWAAAWGSRRPPGEESTMVRARLPSRPPVPTAEGGLGPRSSPFLSSLCPAGVAVDGGQGSDGGLQVDRAGGRAACSRAQAGACPWAVGELSGEPGSLPSV